MPNKNKWNYSLLPQQIILFFKHKKAFGYICTQLMCNKYTQRHHKYSKKSR